MDKEFVRQVMLRVPYDLYMAMKKVTKDEKSNSAFFLEAAREYIEKRGVKIKGDKDES